ncbi:hypothetical protein BLNAU_7114 [Blattamonas nauphoetae]|uniref:Uncharacterized protein n=1 Tax=Blattamonas nauphoetae TaxID=2049346 RepID=A0ABQ9Y2L9_9EUKA|nr:hypothetical protein BLNAU_7114 [Blattamonas nauphoetae]
MDARLGSQKDIPQSALSSSLQLHPSLEQSQSTCSDEHSLHPAQRMEQDQSQFPTTPGQAEKPTLSFGQFLSECLPQSSCFLPPAPHLLLALAIEHRHDALHSDEDGEDEQSELDGSERVSFQDSQHRKWEECLSLHLLPVCSQSQLGSFVLAVLSLDLAEVCRSSESDSSISLHSEQLSAMSVQSESLNTPTSSSRETILAQPTIAPIHDPLQLSKHEDDDTASQSCQPLTHSHSSLHSSIHTLCSQTRSLALPFLHLSSQTHSAFSRSKESNLMCSHSALESTRRELFVCRHRHPSLHISPLLSLVLLSKEHRLPSDHSSSSSKCTQRSAE